MNPRFLKWDQEVVEEEKDVNMYDSLDFSDVGGENTPKEVTGACLGSTVMTHLTRASLRLRV